MREDLDILNAELHTLTDHAVALDANVRPLSLSIFLAVECHLSNGALRTSMSGPNSFWFLSFTAYRSLTSPQFDKFGYSAHLRTTDAETASLSSDAPHLDRSTNPLKFFRRPQVRQYFHKGLLWRSSKHGEVPAFELFIDLVYVGVIDVIGERAAENPSGLALLHFIITFSISWKVWSDMGVSNPR